MMGGLWCGVCWKEAVILLSKELAPCVLRASSGLSGKEQTNIQTNILKPSKQNV